MAAFIHAEADSPILIPDSLTTLNGALMPLIYVRSSDSRIPATPTPMSAFEGGYVARDVTVTGGGFNFLAPDSKINEPSSQWQMTWYSYDTEAVNPPLIQYFNPLSATTDPEKYISVPDGTYNIYYFDQLTTKSHCQLFTYEPVSDADTKLYPPAMYLLTSDSQALTIPEISEGIYQGFVILPPDGFKVSFQTTGYDVPALLFGPESSTRHHFISGQSFRLVYGTNTYAAFGYSATVPQPNYQLRAGDKALVRIDLKSDANTVQLIADQFTSASLTDTGEAGVAQLYTLSGLSLNPDRLKSGRLTPGIYLLRMTDGTVRRHYVR